MVNLVFTPAILLLTFTTPISAQLKLHAANLSSNNYAVASIYFLFFSLFMLVFDLPLSYYSGFVLEHRFGLSNQTLGAWIVDTAKKSVLSFVLSLLLLLALYALIWTYPENWWVYAWAAYAVVSYVMGKIFPVFIIPMFYKYGNVEDEVLKTKIFSMAEKQGLPVENVYSLNLSKTTKKANAAFMGIGKTKRVVLSDTLIENFTHEEIETVVAHELGHFKHKDIWKQLFVGLVISFIGFWVAFKVMGPLSVRFGFEGIWDISALPLLFFVFYLFSLILTPAQNGFSRWIERQADEFALRVFPYPKVFISCMTKLAEVNLSNPKPGALYEWFFFDHPSISKRIQMAEKWGASA